MPTLNYMLHIVPDYTCNGFLLVYCMSFSDILRSATCVSLQQDNLSTRNPVKPSSTDRNSLNPSLPIPLPTVDVYNLYRHVHHEPGKI